MAFIDYVIVGILLFSAVFGIVRGFVREVCALLTWVLAVFFAFRYGQVIEPYLGGALEQQPYRTWAARVPVFILVLMVGTAVGALLAHFVRVSFFSGLDRMLGFLVGLARGFVVLGLAALLCQNVRLDGEAWWKQSRLLPYVEDLADLLRSVAGENLSRGTVARGTSVRH
jgi:membrane protein required for colicin V production